MQRINYEVTLGAEARQLQGYLRTIKRREHMKFKYRFRSEANLVEEDL